MTIPDFQPIMLPILRILRDGDKNAHEITDILAGEFHLTDAEKRQKLISNGSVTVFSNRIHWAKLYLSKANLIESPDNGMYRISRRGMKVIQENLGSLSVQYLLRFPEIQEWLYGEKTPKTGNNDPSGKTISANLQNNEPAGKNPESLIEEGYQIFMKKLSLELLNKIKGISSPAYEELVFDLLNKFGYNMYNEDTVTMSGASDNDGFHCVIINHNEIVYLRAKKADTAVTLGEVEEFNMGMIRYRAAKGIFITIADFDDAATEYLKKINKNMNCINGETLAQFMIYYDLAVQKIVSYEIKQIDMGYFDD